MVQQRLPANFGNPARLRNNPFPNFDTGGAFADFLETTAEGRRSNFFGRINQPLTFGGSNFANQLFGQRESAFLGNLGRQILGGQTPTATFTDELNKNFNFARQLRRAPVSQTGRGTSQFTSPGRFLLNL